MEKPTLEKYLERLASMVDDDFGQRLRSQFKDISGSSELAMLASPSSEELAQLTRAVAIMTAIEKSKADSLDDEQVEQIAKDALVDVALFAMFINGYSLFCQRVR